MKKISLVIVSLVLFLSLVTGCGSKDATGTEGGSTGKSMILKVGHIEPEDRSTHVALLNFQETIEEKTDGRIKVEIHPNGVLGGDVQEMESVAMGTLDMALPSTSVLVAYSPEFGILDMPYLFKTPQNAFDAMDGELGAYFNEKVESVGIKSLGYSYNGLRSMTNNVRPISKPEDVKGLKMRVMENPVFIDFFQTLGANATPMSFNELFTGLQQNTVDGQENPPSLIYGSKFYEVQKYLSTTEHVNNFLSLIINKNLFESLSQEDQKIIEDAGKAYVAEQRKLELEDNQKSVEKLAKEGMQVNELTQEERASFRTALQPMYDKYKATFGEELFNMAEKYNK
ncbi:MAG: TRAP transporter substrate-binding protein [Eubacteriaceae bacterium]